MTTMTLMKSVASSRFVYVTFIRTTRERLWAALTDAEQNKQFWFGMMQESDWKTGSPWRLKFPDGRVADEGTILESDPPRLLAIRWNHRWKPECAAEGEALCTIEIERIDEKVVKLTIDHSIDIEDSQLIRSVAGGWPRILSNLKSWLETGEVILGAS